MVPTSENKIKALIRLLSDDNDRIAKTIGDKLVEIGDSAVPLLLEAELEHPGMARRIEGILDEIRGSRLEEELRGLVTRPGHRIELEAGAFLIARYGYPGLEVEAYVRRLDGMAGEGRDLIGARGSGEGAVQGVSPHLFIDQGFRGNHKNHHEGGNSYLKHGHG